MSKTAYLGLGLLVASTATCRRNRKANQYQESNRPASALEFLRCYLHITTPAMSAKLTRYRVLCAAFLHID
jgi:hypothetical protein